MLLSPLTICEKTRFQITTFLLTYQVYWYRYTLSLYVRICTIIKHHSSSLVIFHPSSYRLYVKFRLIPNFLNPLKMNPPHQWIKYSPSCSALGAKRTTLNRWVAHFYQRCASWLIVALRETILSTRRHVNKNGDLKDRQHAWRTLKKCPLAGSVTVINRVRFRHVLIRSIIGNVLQRRHASQVYFSFLQEI